MLVVFIELNAPARSHFRDIPVDRTPPAYRARLARKTHADARMQSIAGLWLLEQALEHAGYDTDMLGGVDFDSYDRPHLAAGPAFSISHSDRFAACALADTPGGANHVGLDIEQPRAIPPARLARLASSDDERKAIARQPARFFDYWCAREATVKATGRVGLKRIRQVRLKDGQAWLDGQCWALQPLALAPGLAACLASDSSTETVHIRPITVPPRC